MALCSTFAPTAILLRCWSLLMLMLLLAPLKRDARWRPSLERDEILFIWHPSVHLAVQSSRAACSSAGLLAKCWSSLSISKVHLRIPAITMRRMKEPSSSINRLRTGSSLRHCRPPNEPPAAPSSHLTPPAAPHPTEEKPVESIRDLLPAVCVLLSLCSVLCGAQWT